MNESIDLVTLRVVISAADFGSISSACNHLGLSVAAASTRISLLEDSLGFRIFDRSPRGVHPTQAGHMLLERSRALLSDADRLAADLQDYSRGLKGHVRVLSNASALMEILPSLIERFTRDYPLIQIEVEERGSPDIPQALLEGRVDVGILDLPVAPPGLHFTDFFNDTLVLLVPQGHRLAGQPEVALRDALEEPFIGLANSTALSLRLQGSASAEGQKLKVRMRMQSFDAQTRMIAGGSASACCRWKPLGHSSHNSHWSRSRSRTVGRAVRIASPCAMTLCRRQPPRPSLMHCLQGNLITCPEFQP